MAETEITTSAAPAIAWEYVWFGGQPVAQIASATGAIEWTFTDHLGTPLLQTDATAQITWRAEYEPYGTIHTLRAGTGKHQPLRFPGQEAEEGGEVAYNIFRWYRAGWGRYTQSDPLHVFRTLSEESQAYGYALDNPLKFRDPLGLYTVGGSCARCENLDARDSRNLSEFILDETSRWCRTRLSGVTDVRLRDCMREQCRNGRVECEDCEDPSVYGRSDTRAGAIGHWFARRSPNRTAYVCIATQGNYLGEAGNTVVHEWAHGCGCNADIAGECPGIPGLPTGRTYQRRTPRRGR
jgi:RHS repeat-associated protein